MSGEVRIEREGPIARLVFDQERRRNAITVDMWRAIPDRVAEVAEDRTVRVVVMRGAGTKAFVSGADISEFEATHAEDGGKTFDATTARAFEALRALDKPLIAAIHGACVGGGAAIALCADLRLAADDARFAIPPARLGIAYPTEGLRALVRIVGFSEAADLLFTARQVSAEDAHRIGLVNKVVPKELLNDTVDRLAHKIADNAPLTIRSAKVTLQELAKVEAERDLDRVRDSVKRCYQSEDFKEGVRAFLEKRKPHFEGN
ncbi:MAG: enoyl-CoA hydratase/carnithine racemase [Bradymonadia bacterium]|jgi:enoyl-CoA hydratase/carnithine racemase